MSGGTNSGLRAGACRNQARARPRRLPRRQSRIVAGNITTFAWRRSERRSNPLSRSRKQTQLLAQQTGQCAVDQSHIDQISFHVDLAPDPARQRALAGCLSRIRGETAIRCSAFIQPFRHLFHFAFFRAELHFVRSWRWCQGFLHLIL